MQEQQGLHQVMAYCESGGRSQPILLAAPLYLSHALQRASLAGDFCKANRRPPFQEMRIIRVTANNGQPPGETVAVMVPDTGGKWLVSSCTPQVAQLVQASFRQRFILPEP